MNSQNFSNEFDNLIGNFTDGSKTGKNIPAVQIYHSTTRLLLVWDKSKDKDRIEKLCRHEDHFFYLLYKMTP
jgi:hypothetical protein